MYNYLVLVYVHVLLQYLYPGTITIGRYYVYK